MPSEAERLSLQASHVIAERAAALCREDPNLDWPAATRKAMAENPIAAAGYAGDTQAFASLAASHRARNLSAGPPAPRRQAPRSHGIRPIGSKAELLPGEVLLVKLAGPAAGGGLFAERIGG